MNDMLLESPAGWKDYELIDSGGFEKLERFGKYIMSRPEPKALWDKSLSKKQWADMAHTEFTAGAGFGKSGKEDSGIWHMLKKMPGQWNISYGSGRADSPEFNLRLGLTSFKHVGVFPEQAPNWDYIYRQTKRVARSLKGDAPRPPKVLNLFAYTGAASLAAKCAGADTTHLDSVRQVVTWAKENMQSSGLDNIRWIIEDALKFVRREAKRGNRYDGLILDPPAYGHGPDGEKWKLDECLFDLLSACSSIVEPENSFVVLNLYSNGYSALLGKTVMESAFGLKKNPRARMEFGELYLEDRAGRALPLSVFVRMER